jgi:hypothetical protein
VPQVRQSVPGLKMIFFDCFYYPSLGLLVDRVKTVVGFAGLFRAQVRFGEPGAPVEFLLGHRHKPHAHPPSSASTKKYQPSRNRLAGSPPVSISIPNKLPDN